MPTMTDALVTTGGQFAPTDNSYMANLIAGGQLGFGPNLPNLDANTPAVYLPLQIIVTHVPTIFTYIPNGTAYIKSIFETQMVSMEGIDFAYTMDVEGTPVGRDGQMQNVPIRQQRSQISPVCLWPEKIGNPIFNMGRFWMNCMRDVDTQASNLAGLVSSSTTLPPLVASMYAMDIFCIQYDSTMKASNIIDAFAITNMFPTDIGSPGYQYNATEAHRPDRSFTFTGIVQHNRNTLATAINLANLVDLSSVNFNEALPIATTVEAAIASEGLAYQMSEFLSNFTDQTATATTTSSNSV